DSPVADATLFVDSGRVPCAAAAVELRVAPPVGGNRVEGPADAAVLRIERVKLTDIAGLVEGAEQGAGHGRDEDHSVVDHGLDVDAFADLGRERFRPDFLPGFYVECHDGEGSLRRINLAVPCRDAVRPDVVRTIVRTPLLF